MYTPLSDPLKPARVGSVVLGPAPVKVLASLMPADTEELLADAENAAAAPLDIFEWRADYFQNQTKSVWVSAGASLQAMADKPILWTLRTNREGGLFAKSDEEYLDVVDYIAKSGLFDALDIELERGDVASIVQAAHKTETTVVMSYHNFAETPDSKDIMDKLDRMAIAGADVLKVALMPQKPEDVLTLMQTTILARRTYDVPVISMSMGAAGQCSRVLGSLYGSCATFASLQKASAPGQISAQTLAEYLNVFSI